MTDKEKLIELQMQAKIGWTKAEFADHLIANGVRFTPAVPGHKDNFNIAEMAYKNGYEDGKPKWISVKDWLPQANGIYQVFIYDKEMERKKVWYGQFTGYDWFVYDIYGDGIRCEVTHWMPLPEAPKGDE